MSQSPVDYLRHILDECEYISSVIPDGFTKEQLLDDETLRLAVSVAKKFSWSRVI